MWHGQSTNLKLFSDNELRYRIMSLAGSVCERCMEQYIKDPLYAMFIGKDGHITPLQIDTFPGGEPGIRIASACLCGKDSNPEHGITLFAHRYLDFWKRGFAMYHLIIQRIPSSVNRPLSVSLIPIRQIEELIVELSLMPEDDDV